MRAGQIPVNSRIRALEKACNAVSTNVEAGNDYGAMPGFFAGLRTNQAMEVFKELTSWDDNTELMVREADIATFEFGMISKIISSPCYVSFMKCVARYAPGTRDIDWVRLHGKYMLDKEYKDEQGEVFYLNVKHRDLDVSMPLPFGMKISKSSTYAIEDLPAQVRIEQNSSSLKAKLICGGGSQVPLAALFKNHQHCFEPVLKQCMSKEEYTILHNMVTDENFDLSAHVMSRRSAAYAATQGSDGDLASSVMRSALPSLTSSPSKRRRFALDSEEVEQPDQEKKDEKQKEEKEDEVEVEETPTTEEKENGKENGK